MRTLLSIIAATGLLSLLAAASFGHAAGTQAKALKLRMVSLEDMAMLDALADSADTSRAFSVAAGGIQLAAGVLGLLLLRRAELRRRKVFLPVCLAALSLPLFSASAQPMPALLPRAHAHTDHEHARPLLEALRPFLAQQPEGG